MKMFDTAHRAPRRRWVALLALPLMLLQGCGSSDAPATDPPPPPAPTATLQGRLASALDGSAIAGATVSAGGRSATTGADGRWRLEGLAPADRQLLRVSAAGFADGLLALPAPAGEGGSTEWPLLTAGSAVAIDPTQPATVEDSGTGARLAAPANAFVRAEGGAAPTGGLTVRLTSVDPALDPARMPGDYTTVNAGTVRVLESFGAVQVDVRDAAGNRYTIAPGRSATLRIPASSRGSLPDTVGLYSLDEATGRWVDEGTAQLATSGNRRWYEATVTHLSWWNADLPLETVFANGCLRDLAGNPAPARTLRSVGIDYTGSATVRSDAAGNFRVAFKKGGRASLVVDAPSGGGAAPQPPVLGPTETDITLPACLQDRGSTSVAPTILGQPQAQVANAGTQASFTVLADGVPAPRYQWQRNGVDLAGATGPVLNLLATALDHAASYRVRVSNSAGSVTSAEASLTVLGGEIAAFVFSPPSDATAAAGNGVSFGVIGGGSPPLSYQWQRNGLDLAGETASTLNLAGVGTGDSGARFRVRVSNPWGSQMSTEATLTVNGGGGSAPAIVSGGPQDTTANVGQQIRWPVQASGATPLSYEWRRNGALINGSTGNTLTFVVQAADNGAEYTVTVRNAQGAVTSAPGRITIPVVTPTGSLTVSGDALRFVDATFTPNRPQNGALVSVQATGPQCPGTTCVSQWGMTATDNVVSGALGTNELLTVFVSSIRPAPGVQPGLQPTSVVVVYAVARAQVGGSDGGGYSLSCGQGAQACPDPATAGITVDPVARTITFSNTRLANGTGAVTTLNGTLGY